jgi:hypothetical protein
MRHFSYLFLALALWLTGPGGGMALAGTAAEARAQAQKSREQSLAIRARQSQLREELNGMAARIEALKAQQASRLLPGGELPDLLRRSQELSDSLTQLAAQLSRSEAEAEAAGSALADALSHEMDRARAAFEQSQDRGERRALLDRLRALRRERDQVRAGLSAAALPTVHDAQAGSDDPEDLLEQADALRDAQDKVSARLRALDRRLGELRQEQELDRRMGEFLEDDLAFDEKDRRFRQGRGFGLATMEDTGGGPAAPAPEKLPSDSFTVGFGGPGRSSTPSSGPVGDGTPQVGLKDGVTAGRGEDELSVLARQRAELESMAAELGKKADELERKAKELR